MINSRKQQHQLHRYLPACGGLFFLILFFTFLPTFMQMDGDLLVPAELRIFAHWPHLITITSTIAMALFALLSTVTIMLLVVLLLLTMAGLALASLVHKINHLEVL